MILTDGAAVEYLFELLQQKKLAQNINYLNHLENCIKLGQMRLDHDSECMTPDERKRFEELEKELKRAVDRVERTWGYRPSPHQVIVQGQDGQEGRDDQEVLWQ